MTITISAFRSIGIQCIYPDDCVNIELLHFRIINTISLKNWQHLSVSPTVGKTTAHKNIFSLI